jgi:hypothetical protein
MEKTTMLLDPIKTLLDDATIPGVDTQLIWAQISKATVFLVESLPDFADYESMDAMPSTTPYVLAIPTGQGLAVTVMFDVVAAGLTSLLAKQLSYVPRYALLEWHIAHPQVMMQNIIVCVGHNAITESLATAQQSVATFSGQEPPKEFLEAIAANPLIIKTWVYKVIEALRTRGMLHQNNVGTAQNPIWMTKIHAATSNQIH